MPGIVTTKMRVFAANQFMEGFSSANQNLYVFIGHTLPWGDDLSGGSDNTPPSPIDCVQDETLCFKDMMSLKQIQASDVSLVIPRYNWKSNTVYTQYIQNVDLFDPTSGLPPFYVVTSDLNVYKCLNNNNGTPSTIQPTGTSTVVTSLADGYQWKFMYTISSGNVLKWVTNEWVPVQTLISNDNSAQWLVQNSVIPGTIDRIDVLEQGTQFTAIPTISIVGDGTGAAATAIISNENLVDVVINNAGVGYTYATVSIVGGGASANGASAFAVISPNKGHGADPVFELGGFFVLINSQLVYDENNTFTTSNDYRRVGIINSPISSYNSQVENSLNLAQSLSLTLTSISGTTFNNDEQILGLTSGAIGFVMDYNSTTYVLRLVETVGSFIPGETIAGSVATGVLQTYTATARAGTISTITLPTSASITNGAYVNQTIFIKSGTGANQTSTITQYIGSTFMATVSPNFTVAPDATSVFVIANIQVPAIQKFTGDILYIENKRPIFRGPNQVESLKIAIPFG